MFLHPRGPRQTTCQLASTRGRALLFASADSRALPCVLTVGLPVTFQGSFPHSAVIVERDSQTSRTWRSPSTGFLNLPTGIISFCTTCGFIPPHLHSQGFDLQSITSKRSAIPLR
jgi:hypothetical protein